MEAQKPIDTPRERDALQEFIDETRERFRRIPIDYDGRENIILPPATMRKLALAISERIAR
jgi:hypothetical protein